MPNTTYPNYETKFSTSPVENKSDTAMQMQKYRDDERNQKAPKILPFELDQNAVQLLGRMYEDLVTLKKLVDKTRTQESAKKKINELIDHVGIIILKEIPTEIDKMYL
jgi:hypothetical protein